MNKVISLALLLSVLPLSLSQIGILSFSLFCFFFCLSSLSPITLSPPNNICKVNTDCGPVHGFVDNANIFLGIPYATPPVGNRRWQNSITRYEGNM